jgi:hypothetical protein
MQVDTTKRDYDKGNECDLPDGEYLFLIKDFKDPVKVSEKMGLCCFVETTAIGVGGEPIEAKPGPAIMIKWHPQGFPYPDWMGEGVFQALNDALDLEEGKVYNTDEYVNLPVIGVVETNTYTKDGREISRKQFKRDTLTKVPEDQMKLVCDHLSKVS